MLDPIRGSPNTVKDQILEAARVYQTTDVSIVTNCHYFEDRLRSFELIAEAFDLPKKLTATLEAETDL